MLYIKALKKNYGIYEILKNVSLSMKKGECLAVTGPNGCGKSTLLKCIMGEIPFESGELYLQEELKIGYLQQKEFSFEGTVKHFLFKEFGKLQDIAIELDDEAVSDMKYMMLMDDYIHLNGFEMETLLIKELSEFGFDEAILSRAFRTLSPGQKKIMEIISIMITNPDLFIMDEPTNHLDIAMRIFLEAFINKKKQKGFSFLLVSHDRTFLDRVSDQTVYIRRGNSEQISGCYSDMLEFIEMNIKARKKESERLSQKIISLERVAQKKKTWSSKVEKEKYAKNRSDRKQPNKIDKGYIGSKASKLAKTAKATAVRKNRLIQELKGKKPFIEKPVKFNFRIKTVENRLLLNISDLSFRYTVSNPLIKNVTFQVHTREKIAIIGGNGCGKTTLFKLLLDEINDYDGEIYRNEKVTYAYLPQDIQTFFRKRRLIENFDDLDLEHPVIHSALKSARLKEETLNQAIESLSRGELMKAAFVKILLSNVEYIFMDEPTNNLDIETLEVLQEIIGHYPGGMMFISHDRRFVSQNAESVYKLESGKLKVFKL